MLATVLARGRLVRGTEGARVTTLPWVGRLGSCSWLGHMGGRGGGSDARWQGERLGDGLESWLRLLGIGANPRITRLGPGIRTARR